MPFFKSLSKFFRKVISLLHMSSPPSNTDPEIPSDTIDITSYCGLIQAHWQLKDDGMELMKAYTVLEVKLYKASTSVLHEYLVLTLACAGKRVATRLVFERGVGQSTPSNEKEFTSSKDSFGSASSQRPSVASSESTVPPHRADDRVSPLEGQEKKDSKDIHLLTLEFPGSTKAPRTLSNTRSSPDSSSSAPSCLHLYELAILARTVHTMNERYKLFSKNCYFYAGLITKILKQRYNPTEEWIRDGQTQAGTCHLVSIYSHKETDDKNVREAERAALEQFNTDLATLENLVKDTQRERKDAKEAKTQLAAKDAEIASKDNVIAAKDNAIAVVTAAKDDVIAAKDNEIAELYRQLAQARQQ